MKKLMLSALSGVFLVALFAVAQTEVASINIVGYSKKPVTSNNWAMMSCNFDKVGGGTNTLLDIFGTNQLKGVANLTSCDKIILWQTSNLTYQTYAQRTGFFYKANSVAQWTNAQTQSIVENGTLVPAGVGMWFVPGGGATNKTLTLMGQVVTVATQRIDIINNWQMLSYPFTTDFKLSNTLFFANGAARSGNLTSCDKIIVWNGSSYQTYALWTNGQWYYANSVTEWTNARAQGFTATNPISMSEGFWYVARSNMVWSETNIYLNNLL